MRPLIDTNIIIDGLQSRKGFMEDAGMVMLRACDYDGYITASSLTDIFYLQARYFHNKAKAKNNMAELMRVFDILDTTGSDCKNALRGEMTDFEDAVLLESAMREKIDIIVTRNKKDFVKSSIEVCSPVEFLRKLSD